MKTVPKYKHSHYAIGGGGNYLESAKIFGATSVTRHVENKAEIQCIKLEQMSFCPDGETSVRTVIDNQEDPSAYFTQREHALKYAEYLSEKTGIEIFGK